MLARIRSCLTYANVMATVAVFIALGGSSYAALRITSRNVPKDALTGADIKNLTGKDVRNNSLDNRDVKNLLARDFKAGQLPAGPQGAKGDKGATGDPGPLVETLPSGRTLRGSFNTGHDASAASQRAEGAISYPFPLASSPEAHVIQPGGTPPAQCPGTVANPQAVPGHLCVFVSGKNGSGSVASYGTVDGSSNYRYGAGIYLFSQSAELAEAWGTWAVTAP